MNVAFIAVYSNEKKKKRWMTIDSCFSLILCLVQQKLLLALNEIIAHNGESEGTQTFF